MDKKIKVALIIRGFHNGGIEKVFEEYYSHMDLSLYEIHIITNMKNIPEIQKKFEKMGCTIHALSPMKGHRFTLKNIKEYNDLFRNGKFDVVHNNVPDNLFPLYFAKKYGVPVRILHSHNIYTDDFDKKNKLIAKLFLKGFAINVANATKLVAVSELAAQSAFANRSSEAIILKNAIDLDKFKFNPVARSKIREQLGLNDTDILFGHIGRYENNQKNQEFVLTLFREILINHENCRLVMIGEGQRRNEFMEMARKLKIDDKTIFAGSVSNVNEYLSAMDIYLFPSRKEGLGIAAIEAQTSGVKCIVSDKMVKEALLTNNIDVLSIEGNEAVDIWSHHIERLLSSVLLQKDEERAAGINQVSKAGFDIRNQIIELEMLYNGVHYENKD